MPKRDICIGLEVECEVRRFKHHVSGYHERNWVSKYWSAERDASLSLEKFLPLLREGTPITEQPRAIEFVSRVLTRDTIGFAMSQLKALVGDMDDDLTNIWFNPTMGCHIHFSYPLKGKTSQNAFLSRKLPVETIEKIRQRALAEIENEDFRSHYNRSYSRPITKTNYGDRGEFYFDSGAGVEWRAFNLLGCTTWSDVCTRLAIAINIIDEEIGVELDKPEPFYHTSDVSVEIPDESFVPREIINSIYMETLRPTKRYLKRAFPRGKRELAMLARGNEAEEQTGY